MNEEEPSCIKAREAWERRAKATDQERAQPEEVIITDGEGISLAASHILRFWERVRKQENGCWEWIGSKWSNGYGSIMIHRTKRKVHRISFLIHNGFLPGDKNVCHTCDNPSCVRPDHLFLGTNQDNTADMVAKGRSTHGERNGRAVLSEEQVIAIRENPPRGKWAKQELASKLGLTVNSIYNLLKGETWKRI